MICRALFSTLVCTRSQSLLEWSPRNRARIKTLKDRIKNRIKMVSQPKMRRKALTKKRILTMFLRAMMKMSLVSQKTEECCLKARAIKRMRSKTKKNKSKRNRTKRIKKSLRRMKRRMRKTPRLRKLLMNPPLPLRLRRKKLSMWLTCLWRRCLRTQLTQMRFTTLECMRLPWAVSTSSMITSSSSLSINKDLRKKALRRLCLLAT